jgi:predicted Zn-dependent protease
VIAVRAGIVVLAVAAIAWLALGIAASHAQDDLAHLVAVTDHPTAAQVARASDLRRDAERWVPGRRPSLLEATLRLKGGDTAGAARLLTDVVRDEPENGEAWLLLSQAARDRDPALAERARARVRALAPEVPPP